MWSTILSDTTALEAYRRYIDRVNEALNCYVNCEPKEMTGEPEGELSGIPLAVKDNIAVENLSLTCGSALLGNFVSPFDATAVSRLKAAGAQIVGKTNLDEFGMGADTSHSVHGAVHNPWDTSRTPGGSSGGSAAAVASGTVPLALGSDTGGSVRQPASFCGIYGLKPGYGAVSRYGLVAFASSLDVVGLLSEDLQLLEKAFRVVRGKDTQDQTSVDIPKDENQSPLRRVGIIASQDAMSSEVVECYDRACEELRRQGVELQQIDPRTLEYVAPAYHIISTAEASANLARFDGLRYGLRQTGSEDLRDMIAESRSKGFGHEVKMRILLGTYVLRSGFFDQYYGKAQKVRAAICEEWNAFFESLDAVLLPTYPVKAFSPDEVHDEVALKSADVYTALANLTGHPALAYPVDMSEGVPVGVQLMGPRFSELRLIRSVASMHQDRTLARPPDFPGLSAWIKEAGR